MDLTSHLISRTGSYDVLYSCHFSSCNSHSSSGRVSIETSRYITSCSLYWNYLSPTHTSMSQITAPILDMTLGLTCKPGHSLHHVLYVFLTLAWNILGLLLHLLSSDKDWASVTIQHCCPVFGSFLSSTLYICQDG